LGENFSEDEGEGKLAQFSQHNLAPSDLSSSFPSKVILYSPKGVGEVEIHFLQAWGCWEMSPTKNPPEISELFYFSLFFRESAGCTL
jgi:hypothetical protein